MTALLVALWLLSALLVFEAGTRWQLRSCRRQERQIARRMQSQLDARLHAAHEAGR